MEVTYLTRRQREALDFIKAFVKENGYGPSLREIGSHLGVSAVSTVHEHLVNLAAKGMVRRGWNRARSVELVEDGAARAARVPMIGRVAAGAPIEAVEVPGSVTVPLELAGRGDTFALEVKGDSMIEDGIFDGDTIIVESRRRVENGSLAVVLIDGEEATVKRFYLDGDTARLRPSNPAMSEISVPAGRVEVRGVVVGLLRNYA